MTFKKFLWTGALLASALTAKIAQAQNRLSFGLELMQPTASYSKYDLGPKIDFEYSYQGKFSPYIGLNFATTKGTQKNTEQLLTTTHNTNYTLIGLDAGCDYARKFGTNEFYAGAGIRGMLISESTKFKNSAGDNGSSNTSEGGISGIMRAGFNFKPESPESSDTFSWGPRLTLGISPGTSTIEMGVIFNWTLGQERKKIY